MTGVLESDARGDICSKGFDRAELSSLTPRFRDVTYKGVLVPLYTANYGYGGRTYSYAINGQSGRVCGQYPKSIPKIVAAVLAGVLALIGMMYLFGFDEGGRYAAAALPPDRCAAPVGSWNPDMPGEMDIVISGEDNYGTFRTAQGDD